MPQDEVLAAVRRRRRTTVAVQAVRLGWRRPRWPASTGKGGGSGLAPRPLTAGLGLEQLTFGTDERGESTIEGGRQLTERVYIGARQGGRARETQGVLRMELTPRIKLEADVGVTGGTRAGAAYEREY